jgi:hypothetical protein
LSNRQAKNMIHNSLMFLCGLMMTVVLSPLTYAQKSSARIIVGCYSDLNTSTGDVIGAGVVKITKKNGKYSGTFEELRNERGDAWEAIPLENLVVNEQAGIITFDIKFHRIKDINTCYLETVRRVTGKTTKSGIKMNWRGKKAEYGSPNPYMKRSKDCY